VGPFDILAAGGEDGVEDYVFAPLLDKHRNELLRGVVRLCGNELERHARHDSFISIQSTVLITST
jgi:hypothetical protein